MSQITVVGGGIAGLTGRLRALRAAAPCACSRPTMPLGGRARLCEGPTKQIWSARHLQGRPVLTWLTERTSSPPTLDTARRSWLRLDGAIGAHHPWAHPASAATARFVRRQSSLDFRSWAAVIPTSARRQCSPRPPAVYTFHHDPGELSAAFVWPRTVRPVQPATGGALHNRRVGHGWSRRWSVRLVALGVDIETAAVCRSCADADDHRYRAGPGPSSSRDES